MGQTFFRKAGLSAEDLTLVALAGVAAECLLESDDIHEAAFELEFLYGSDNGMSASDRALIEVEPDEWMFLETVRTVDSLREEVATIAARLLDASEGWTP